MDLAAVLSGDRGAGGVRAALASSALRRSVRAALAGMLDGSADLGACRLRRTEYKPDHKLRVWFDVAVGWGAERPVAVSWWASAPPAPTRADLEAEAAGRGLLAPFRTLTSTAGGMRVDVAP